MKYGVTLVCVYRRDTVCGQNLQGRSGHFELGHQGKWV